MREEGREETGEAGREWRIVTQISYEAGLGARMRDLLKGTDVMTCTGWLGFLASCWCWLGVDKESF